MFFSRFSRTKCEGPEYTGKAMGLDAENWAKIYETVPLTEAEKLYNTFSEMGLGK